MRVAPGANFLLLLNESNNAKVLVADDYNPWQFIPTPGLPRETEIVFRRGFAPAVHDAGDFGELVVETNRRRFGRDGSQFPPQRYSRSVLRFGHGDPSAPDFDSLAQWYTDAKAKTILVRIPLGTLLFTDPSSWKAYYGFDARGGVRTVTSVGVDVSAFELDLAAGAALANSHVVAAYPAAPDGMVAHPFRLTWRPWESVTPEMFPKKAYYALQNEFAGNVQPAAAQRRLRAATGNELRSGAAR
jgi:hypothetical protein